MPTNPVEMSDGLRKILKKYCEYRGWESVAPDTVRQVRELIVRAGSVEEAFEGLKFFFDGNFADPWVKEVRPNLALKFLIENWERFEIHKAESRPRSNYFSWNPSDYAVMRA